MSKGKFSQWVDDKHRQEERAANGEEEESESFLGRFSSFQNDIATQLEGLSGALPDNVMSEAFRARIKNSIFLLLAAIFFAIMAVFVGIPTIVLKPAKFVTCVAMATLCIIFAIAVMQKPEVFVKSLFSGGIVSALPFLLLVTSLVGTIYITIFHQSYLNTIISLVFLSASMIFFMASFIPGGTKGLQVLARAGVVVVRTTVTPVLFVVRKCCEAFLSRLMS
jgi:hypothetical protein